MKTAKIIIIILFFVLVSLFCAACSDSDSDEDNDESIVGTWNWYKTSGGIGGIIQTPASTGETKRVVFESNGNVTFYTNDAITLSSTYTLSKEKTILSDQILPVVKVQGFDTYVYSFPYTDELELQEAVVDGFIHNYRKG